VKVPISKTPLAVVAGDGLKQRGLFKTITLFADVGVPKV
jgi:hypothetical protein